MAVSMEVLFFVCISYHVPQAQGNWMQSQGNWRQAPPTGGGGGEWQQMQQAPLPAANQGQGFPQPMPTQYQQQGQFGQSQFMGVAPGGGQYGRYPGAQGNIGAPPQGYAQQQMAQQQAQQQAQLRRQQVG